MHDACVNVLYTYVRYGLRKIIMRLRGLILLFN